jgi:sulfur carrier protein
MKVTVNGEEKSVHDAISVSELLAALHGAGPDTRGIAVALNGEVVSRSRWAESNLGEGDRVEVLRAVGGGA